MQQVSALGRNHHEEFIAIARHDAKVHLRPQTQAFNHGQPRAIAIGPDERHPALHPVLQHECGRNGYADTYDERRKDPP